MIAKLGCQLFSFAKCQRNRNLLNISFIKQLKLSTSINESMDIMGCEIESFRPESNNKCLPGVLRLSV